MKRFNVRLELLALEELIVVSDIGFTAFGMLGGIEKISADITRTDQLGIISDDSKEAVSVVNPRLPNDSLPLRKVPSLAKLQNYSEHDTSISKKTSLPDLLDLSFGKNLEEDVVKATTLKSRGQSEHLTFPISQTNGRGQLLDNGSYLHNNFGTGFSRIEPSAAASQLDQLDTVMNALSTSRSQKTKDDQGINGPQMISTGGGGGRPIASLSPWFS